MRFAKRSSCGRGQGGRLSQMLLAAVTSTRGAMTALAVLSFALSAAEIPAGSIYTPYACTNFVGLPHVSGTNDGTGAAARFNTPGGVATDTTGNIYVADAANTIRKITPAGTVTTLAGSAGQAGFSDGAGGTARFNNPIGIAIDLAGDCYVADCGNNTIRKITPAGVVTTVAGSPGQSGSIDDTNNAARFNSPQGLAVDNTGNIYVTDSFNNTIRKLTPAGVVTTMAGTAGQAGTADGTGAAARFNWPTGVAADTSGNLYVADTGNDLIRRITAAGIVSTFAGNGVPYGFDDGMCSQAGFNFPQGIAVDRFGNIYVAEEANDMIRRITPGGMVTTLAGSPNLEGRSDGIGSTALFYGPVGVAVDSVGNLYVADSNNARIAKCTQAFLEFNSTIGSLMLSSGSFHTWLSGPADKRFVVEASTDLLSWTPVLTNVLPAGGASLGVPVGNNQFRFLRSRLGL